MHKSTFLKRGCIVFIIFTKTHDFKKLLWATNAYFCCSIMHNSLNLINNLSLLSTDILILWLPISMFSFCNCNIKIWSFFSWCSLPFIIIFFFYLLSSYMYFFYLTCISFSIRRQGNLLLFCCFIPLVLNCYPQYKILYLLNIYELLILCWDHCKIDLFRGRGKSWVLSFVQNIQLIPLYKLVNIVNI